MKRRSQITLLLLLITTSVIAQTSIYTDLKIFTSTVPKPNNSQLLNVVFDSLISVSDGVNIEVSLKKETLFYANGEKQFVRYYQDDIPFGTWKYYSLNGNLKHSINNFKNYYVVNTYFTNHNIQKSRKYNNGQKEVLSSCKEEQYYPDGSMYGYGKMEPITIINQVNLLEDGKWKYFHPNGEIESKGKYTSGKKDGNWTYYDKKGVKRKAIHFENGEINSQKEY